MACECSIVECVRVGVNPCSPGTEINILSPISGDVNVTLEFNGAVMAFSISVEEGENIVLPTVVLNEKYTHKLEIFGECYELVTSPVIYGGATVTPTPPSGGSGWQWGGVAANGVVVQSPLLMGDLAPILWINEQPIDWADKGVTHDPGTGELDFSAIGAVYGTVYFQYKNL